MFCQIIYNLYRIIYNVLPATTAKVQRQLVTGRILVHDLVETVDYLAESVDDLGKIVGDMKSQITLVEIILYFHI